MTLGEILKQLRNEKKLTLRKLEELSGVSQGYIGDLENENKNVIPKKDKLEELLKVLQPTKEVKKKIIDLYSDALLTPEMKQIIKGKNEFRNVESFELMEVPLFKSVSAGLGCDAIDDIYDFIAVPKTGGNIMAVEVQGDSMEDTIMDGAIIVVNKDILPEVGEIGVFLTTGTEYPEGLVKRLRNKNGHFILESDNPKYDDITIESKNIVACGKVIRIMNDTYKRKKDPVLAAYNNLDENDQAIIKNMIEALSKKNK
ncbi:XRE family transcriptional regulator [Fusobacterium varium]|uniref:LexA family transcriptional regulator n=1 Tax=Fusobacterium varium TaxID=856 RepID=UPI0032C01EBA